MKKSNLRRFAFLSSLVLASSFSVTACKSAEVVYHIDFSFNVSTTRKGSVYLGIAEQIRIIESRDKTDKKERNYSYYLVEPTDSQYLTVDANGNIDPIALTPKKGDIVGGEKLEEDYEVGIEVYEENSELSRYLYLKVGEKYPEADGGYNFSSDLTAKTKILGKLEEYAMSNYLTGISLFENGGYVRYSPRVHLPTQNYITGYGFGLLSEGNLNESSWQPKVSQNKDYYRTATSSDPLDINAWMATGSQVSDLNSYISTSYWGTKIDPEDSSKYTWYPILAKDDCLDPVAIDSDGNEHRNPDQEVEDYKSTHDESEEGYKLPKTIYKTWRIYVKTNEIAYRTASGASSAMKTAFNNRPVELADYEFVYKMLLTGATKLKRGTELASDTSYGIKGGYSFNLRTAGYSGNTKKDYDDIDSAWNSMKANGTLGIKTSDDLDGYTGAPFIQFELVNPVDQFTAKYTLSSNLYSPLPEAFIGKIGGSITDGDTEIADKNWIKGAQKFGRFDGQSIDNRVLCLGPYFLDYWTKNQETAFKRNDNWFEHTEQGRYNIPGVHIRVISKAQTVPDAIYQEFLQDTLDSTGIPSSRMSERKSTDKKTRGDSTFKLNVNSCSQDRWNELNKQIWKNETAYKVKPFMSNLNFLNGLFWSIDRETFALKRGVNPSYNYFADAYLSDPKAGESYNSTEAHKEAVSNFGIDLTQEDYGYNRAKAVNYFRIAVNELASVIKLGSSASNPTVITMNIQWMYPSDEYEYGQDIGNYFMDAFNDKDVCAGRVKLVVKHDADQQWEQVYNDHLMIGKFDLGFGAISGNSLNPLNFMEVLRSDNSSGFTLNWGADTSKFDGSHPIIYDQKEWSYDSLWATADHGSIVSQGLETKTVTEGYVDATAPLGGEFSDEEKIQVNDFAEHHGGKVLVPFSFVKVSEGAEFEIERIQLYLVGAGTFSIDSSHIQLLNKDKQVIGESTEDKAVAYIVLEFTEEMVTEINQQIFDGNKYQKAIDKLSPTDPKYDEKVYDYKHKFTYNNYFSKRDNKGMWMIEIYYNVMIDGSEETESEYDVLKNSKDDPNAKVYLAKF